MSVVDEVKQRTDIVELIGQYTPLTKSGRTFRGLCPFHSEKRPSFFVYPDQQSWHCFGACNTGGDAFSFIMKKESLDFGEALHLLANRARVIISARTEQETKGKDRLHQANQAAAQYFHDLLLNSPSAKKAQQYLERRGVSPQTISAFQLGFSLNSREALKKHLMEQGYTDKELIAGGLIIEVEGGQTRDRFHNHLMFPILDSRERVAGFGARVLDDSLPKYINSPQTPIFDKSGTLYGINLARKAIREQDQAIIVEGYMDAITAHQNGFLNVVASMGTAVTEKQIDTIRKLSRYIAFALDADAAGEEAMLRGVSYENSLNAEVKIILLPEGKDPDEVIKEEPELWQQLVTQAIPVIDYTIKTVTARLDLSTEKDKSLAMDKLLPIIADIKDDRRRDHYIDELAKLMGASYKSIEAVLSRIKTDRRAKESKPKTMERALRPILSNPIEEYCLSLLLQHPELKANCQNLSPEYFENSQNREVFAACQRTEDWSSLKGELDAAIHEHFDSLVNSSLPATHIEQRWGECTLRLLEQHLRRLEAKRKEMLVLEAQSGGSTAELAKLEEQGIETSVQLREVLTQKSQIRAVAKGERNGFEQ